MDDKHTNIKINDESLNIDVENSVFNQEVKYLSKSENFFINLGSGLLSLLKWVVNFIISIFVSLYSFLKTVVIGVYRGILAIGRYFKRKVHQFVHNDLWGRLSYIVFGAGNLGHKQYVNGAIYLLFEIVFIVFFITNGASSIAGLKNLGEVPRVDNSIMILIYGLLWIIGCMLFVFIWHLSIEAGYRNHRINKFVSYDKTIKGNIEVSNQYSDRVIKDLEENNPLDLKDIETEINQLCLEIENNTELITDINSAHYSKYLLKNTVGHAKSFFKRRTKLENAILKLNAKKEAKIAQIEAKIAATKASGNSDEIDIKVAKLNNKLLSRTSKFDIKIRKVTYRKDELVKQYSSFAALQDTRNHSLYGKFNVYYKHISDLDREILFYKHYDEFVKVYTDSLGGHEEQNAANVEKHAEIKKLCEDNIAKCRSNFDAIRAKRKEILAKLEEAKAEFKAVTVSGNEEDILNAKALLIEKSTRLHNELNNLPNESTIKSMEKDEIKEYKHSYLRDRKFLKTNFTSEEFAEKQVVDYMILTYRFDYKDAVRFTKAILKDKVDKNTFIPLGHEEVVIKIEDLEEQKADFSSNNPDKFVGRPETFVEQIKSLLDNKFHITILTLPLLGIFLMTILPLIFSIVIAFTNYDGSHLPPMRLFTWFGWGNFEALFSMGSEYSGLGEALLSTIGWTFLWAFAATFSNYILGILVALMINKADIKFKKVWRSIFVMTIAIPQFVSLLAIATLLKKNGVIDTLWTQLFGSALGFGQKGNIDLTKFIIIIVNIWVGIPYTILSTTGILMNIPKDLYESSEVDGANRFTQFTKITMPYILFVTGPYLITQFVGNINNFNVIYFLTTEVAPVSGEVGTLYQLKPTDLLITFLYTLITKANNPQYGLASAIGIVIFIICSFFSLIMYGKSGSIQEEDQFQ